MRNTLKSINENIKQGVKKIKATQGKLTQIEKLGVAGLFIFVVCSFAMIIAGIVTQKSIFLIIFAVLIVLGVPAIFLIIYINIKKPQKIYDNQNALEGVGYVAYTELQTNRKHNRPIKYKVAIYTEFLNKPLIAITEMKFYEYDCVNILYLKNSSYCCIVDLSHDID